MTDQLIAAIAAEKLPPRLQDVIAADILNSISDEEKWQAMNHGSLVNHPIIKSAEEPEESDPVSVRSMMSSMNV